MSAAEVQAKKAAYQEIIEFATEQIKVISSGPDSGPTASDFDSLPWKTTKKGFEWIFATDRENNPLEEARALVEAIAAAGGKLVQWGFVYTPSKNGKFVQRRKA